MKNRKDSDGGLLLSEGAAREKSAPLKTEEPITETLEQQEGRAMFETKEVLDTPRSVEKSKDKGTDSSGGIQAQTSGLTSAGNVDKIRDILFGAQMREYEKRFVRLEERIQKEFGGLRDDIKKQFESLETYVKREMELLSDRQRTEQTDRYTSIQELSRESKDSCAALDKKISSLEDQFSRRTRDLHDQILGQSKGLSEVIQQKHELISAALEREARELQTDKADRSTLSELLMEMAMRLSNEGGLNLIQDGLLDE